MKLLQQLVGQYPEFFVNAVRESDLSVQSLESSLGITLPESVRWFWVSCGSGLTNAAPSVKCSIEATFRYRRAVLLPIQYIVLDDRNDAGAVLLDTYVSEGRVLWLNGQAVQKLDSDSTCAADGDSFASFAEWVHFCIKDVQGDAV